MRDPIDHERCSELLAPLHHGELDRKSAAEVEAHLETCAECSQELRGLTALGAGEIPPLSDLERTRLRRVVLSEAVPLPDEDASVTPPPAAASRGARLYRVLGAAAVLAVIGGFAYLGFGGMGGGDEAMQSGADSSAEEESVADRDGPQPAAANDGASEGFGEDSVGSSTGSAGGSATDTSEALEAAAPPSPTFKADVGAIDEKRLNRLGRSGLPLVVFSRSFATDDVGEYQTSFIEELAAQAPTARGEDIRTCAGAVTAQFPNSLLAYAALGQFENRGDILVLAFAWTDEDSGPLEQSMVWAWSIGDCDGIPVHYSTNIIRPQR